MPPLPLHSFAHHRPRLALAILLGVAIVFLLPARWEPITRALSAWNIGVWSYLVSITFLLTRATHMKVRTIAEQEDNSAVAVLTVMSFGAVMSIAAIVIELTGARDLPEGDRLMHYAFTASTVLCSWLLVGVLFTFHYAHLFYRAHELERPLNFPDKEKNPDYWDFLYFSFTIAVAVQTSDIAVMSRSMRKAVLAQSILAFFFNAAILGLSINIAAGLVGQ